MSECYIFFSAASYCRLQLSWMSIYLRINACLNCERAWPLVRIHMFYGKRIVCDYFLRCVLSSRIYLLLYSCWTSKSIYTIYIAYPLDEAEGPRQKERARESKRMSLQIPFRNFSLRAFFSHLSILSFVRWLVDSFCAFSCICSTHSVWYWHKVHRAPVFCTEKCAFDHVMGGMFHEFGQHYCCALYMVLNLLSFHLTGFLFPYLPHRHCCVMDDRKNEAKNKMK